MLSPTDQNVYRNLQFLFKIDYIQVKLDAPENRPGDHWHPPASSGDFEAKSSTGWLLRTPDTVEKATNTNGRHFDTCSLFYSSETTYYLGVPFDCRTKCLEEWFQKYEKIGCWERVRFSHSESGDLSTMKLGAENTSLAGRGSEQWVPELVPATYNLDDPYSPPQTTHLAGNLALIMAFVAFACPTMGDTAEVRNVVNNCFKPPFWKPHGKLPRSVFLLVFAMLKNYTFSDRPSLGPNRCGVVVNIRLDPSLDPITSKAHLSKFQNGEHGPLIC